MRKIAISILFLLLLQGCSVTKRMKRDDSAAKLRTNTLTSSDIIANNLTNDGFNIIRADVDFESEGENLKFIASVKFDSGNYLITLRSRTGIEAGRIFLNRDTLLINDRINKVMYYGKPQNLTMLIGYPGDMIPMIFGDYLPSGDISDSVRCVDNFAEIDKVYEGIKLKYVVDCNNRKLSEIIQEGSFNGIESVIRFNDFIAGQNNVYAGSILIENPRKDTRIKIKIDKSEIPWSGPVEFIPGNNYEKREIR